MLFAGITVTCCGLSKQISMVKKKKKIHFFTSDSEKI